MKLKSKKTRIDPFSELTPIEFKLAAYISREVTEGGDQKLVFNISECSRRVNLSRPTIIKGLGGLEDKGVIKYDRPVGMSCGKVTLIKEV